MCNCFQNCINYLKTKYRKHKDHASLHYIFSISLFLVCIGIYIFILASKTTEDGDILNKIIKEFNKQLLFDFFITEYYFEDYENKSINFGLWKGSIEGCKCKENKKFKIHNKKCSELQLRMNCEDIFPRSAQRFEKYRENYFFTSWQPSNETYGYILLNKSSEYKIVANDEECPKGFGICGIFDSFGNKLCSERLYHCPINDIYIDKKNSSKYLYYEDPLNENKSLYYTTNNYNGTIVSGFFIFQERPCYYSDEYIWDTFNELEKGKGKGCEHSPYYDDDWYKYLDSYNRYSLYKENNIYKDSDFDLYGHKGLRNMKNSNVNLFYRNYIGFNHSCLKIKNINDIYSEFLDLKNSTEEERLFHSRVSNDIDYIINKFGKITLLYQLIKMGFYSKLKNWYKISSIINIIYFFNIPEIWLFCSIIYNCLKINNTKRSASEILSNIYDCCDRNTKHELDILQKKIGYIDIMTNNKKVTIIVLMIFILLILYSLIDITIKNLNCLGNKEHNLLDEEKDKEDQNGEQGLKKINELKEINNI